MDDSRSDSLNELVANVSEKEFARIKEKVERRVRATAPAAAAGKCTSPVHENPYVHALDRTRITRPC